MCTLARYRILNYVAPVADQTPTQRLATALLGEPVIEWIRARRPQTPWRRLARELYTVTKGELDVTEQTLMTWAADADESERAEASA